MTLAFENAGKSAMMRGGRALLAEREVGGPASESLTPCPRPLRLTPGNIIPDTHRHSVGLYSSPIKLFASVYYSLVSLRLQ